ncbi:MAG: GPR endopeptidase [Candidatus Limivicinus sp.]
MLYKGRTDLATESFRQLDSSARDLTEKQGVIAAHEQLHGLELMAVEILNEQGSQALGKPIGKYFTLDLPQRFERGAEQFEAAAQAVEELIGRCCKQHDKVLVAALGNPDITPDALGSLAASSVIVTRHLKQQAPADFSTFSSLALCRPGVLGTSGIESAQQVKLLCSRLSPDLVLVIDALAGSDLDRLCRCVQVSTAGISPGSGVGNDRQELSAETLGVPVIAIGIPTVIDAGTLGEEGLSGLFVTPRSIDALVRSGARVIAYGINLAVHQGLGIGDIDMLVS